MVEFGRAMTSLGASTLGPTRTGLDFLTSHYHSRASPGPMFQKFGALTWGFNWIFLLGGLSDMLLSRVVRR